MIFNNSMKILAAAAVSCAAFLMGSYQWSVGQDEELEYAARLAFLHGETAKGVTLYRQLSADMRQGRALRNLVEAAIEKHAVRVEELESRITLRWLWLAGLLGGFSVVILLVVVMTRPSKNLADEPLENSKEWPATPAQVAIIRKLDHWRSTVGLTRSQASEVIAKLMNKAASAPRRELQRLDPYRFMTPAQANRARERDRKVAERKAQSRARAEKLAQKAEMKYQEQLEKEEAALNKVRENLLSGQENKKVKTGKARTIAEFQALMAEILADEKIEAQEVRRIKAWLVSNTSFDGEFDRAIEVIDEALKDGIIESHEEALVYQSVMECLVTLRARKG